MNRGKHYQKSRLMEDKEVWPREARKPHLLLPLLLKSNNNNLSRSRKHLLDQVPCEPS